MIKKLIFGTAFCLVATFSIAQTNKSTTVKNQAKVKTKAPVKPTAPKGETPAQKEARLQKIDSRARAMTASMSKHLNLSLEQQAEVTRINRNSMEQVESARTRYIKNLKKMNAEIQNIGSSRLSLLKDVLTPQQFAAYNQKREEKMGIPKMDEKTASPEQNLTDQ